LPDGSTDVAGNQLALAPKWTFTSAATYEHQLGSGLTAMVGVNYYYRSSFSYDPTLDPSMRVGDVGIWGANASIETADGRWKFTAFARNLTNEHYPAQVRPDFLSGVTGDNALGGSYWQAFDQSAFRTIGVSLDYNY